MFDAVPVTVVRKFRQVVLRHNTVLLGARKIKQ